MPPATRLAQKMKLKPNQRAAIINAPDGYRQQLVPLPEGVELADKLTGKFNWVQIFVKNKAEADKLFPRALKTLKPESLLWISFPKGTSKIQTNLTRDKGWETVHQADLKWVNLISVDDTWSAFAMRPYKPGEARQNWG